MQGVRFIPFLMAAVALSGSMVSGGQAPQATLTLQQPTPMGSSFRVHRDTGALTPLEATKPRRRSAGGGKDHCYIQGDHSPITFRRGEPLEFAASMAGSSRLMVEWTKIGIIYKLEFLTPSEGRRYATSKFVPMDGEPYGDVVSGFDAKRPKDVAQIYVFRPSEPLALGEYALTLAGIVRGDCDAPVSAFSIVE
jgi:hypothetical protein